MKFGQIVADPGWGNDGTDLCPGEGTQIQTLAIYKSRNYFSNYNLASGLHGFAGTLQFGGMHRNLQIVETHIFSNLKVF